MATTTQDQEKLPESLAEILTKQYMVQTRMKAPMPSDFDEVQLTQEQIDELVYNERQRLYYELKRVQEKNIGKNERMELTKPFTTDELKEFVLSINKNFVIDQHAKPIFDLLSFYFSRNKEFETYGRTFQKYGESFSLYKSNLLMGLPGCGKTEILRAFQYNRRQCYHVISINKVNAFCKSNGIDEYKKFTAQVAGWGNTKEFFYQQQVVWGIDDIGLEEHLNDYGNKAFVFSKIIQERSSNKHLLQYYPLHVTTMLTPKQLEEKYGGFIWSRINEQFNIIMYSGPDRRK